MQFSERRVRPLARLRGAVGRPYRLSGEAKVIGEHSGASFFLRPERCVFVTPPFSLSSFACERARAFAHSASVLEWEWCSGKG